MVSWYAGDAFGCWYVRDDLDRDAVETRVAHVTERLVDGGPVGASSLDDLGPEQAMVQIRTAAVILRFPTGPDEGIVVSLDVEVARDLHGFVVECMGQLGDLAMDEGSGAR